MQSFTFKLKLKYYLFLQVLSLYFYFYPQRNQIKEFIYFLRSIYVIEVHKFSHTNKNRNTWSLYVSTINKDSTHSSFDFYSIL